MMLPPDDPRLTQVRLRRELLAKGWSDRALARALKSGQLVRARHGAYVSGVDWRALSEEERFAVRCRAAYAQARTAAVLSHMSALPLLDGPTWGLDLREVHLTRDDGRTGRREAGIRQHQGVLLDRDVEVAHGLRYSSPTKAALEVTMIGAAEASLSVVNHFLHAGETTVDQLRRRYEAHMEHWPSSLRTDLVLRLADRRIESVGESRTSYLLWREDFLAPIPQYEVFDASGRLLARLDFAWPELGIWLEFDGKEKYVKYLAENEDIVDVILREKKREERVAARTGWRCVRITWSDLADPRRVIQLLREAAEAVAAMRARLAN